MANDPTPDLTTYRVICEDGQIRHSARFGTLAEARQFAEWGHVCTNRHTVEPTTTERSTP